MEDKITQAIHHIDSILKTHIFGFISKKFGVRGSREGELGRVRALSNCRVSEQLL